MTCSRWPKVSAEGVRPKVSGRRCQTHTFAHLGDTENTARLVGLLSPLAGIRESGESGGIRDGHFRFSQSRSCGIRVPVSSQQLTPSAGRPRRPRPVPSSQESDPVSVLAYFEPSAKPGFLAPPHNPIPAPPPKTKPIVRAWKRALSLCFVQRLPDWLQKQMHFRRTNPMNCPLTSCGLMAATPSLATMHGHTGQYPQTPISSTAGGVRNGQRLTFASADTFPHDTLNRLMRTHGWGRQDDAAHP